MAFGCSRSRPLAADRAERKPRRVAGALRHVGHGVISDAARRAPRVLRGRRRHGDEIVDQRGEAQQVRGGAAEGPRGDAGIPIASGAQSGQLNVNRVSLRACASGAWGGGKQCVMMVREGGARGTGGWGRVRVSGSHARGR